MDSISNEEFAAIAAALGATCCMVIGILAIFAAIIFFFLYKPLSKVPQVHREMEPGMVFLLFIPLFGIFWLFMVAQRVPASFKSYFDSIGDESHEDCGKNMGMGWAICSAVSLIPYIGFLASLVGIVFMIIFLVKINGMAKQIDADTNALQPM